MYILLTVVFLLIPKTFVMISRTNGHYLSWKDSVSRELIQRDVASHVFSRLPAVTVEQIIQHMQSDFMFTMKAYFLRLCEFVNDASLFYPLFGYLLYIVCMPWLVGDFVPSSDDAGRRWGYLLIYGIEMLDGTWEPMLDTWLFGLYQLAYAVFPFLFYMSFNCTSPVHLYSRTNLRYKRPIHQRWYVRLGVIFICLYHILDCYTLKLFYGWEAFWFSPGKTWFTLWCIYSLYRVRQGPQDPYYDKDK